EAVHVAVFAAIAPGLLTRDVHAAARDMQHALCAVDRVGYIDDARVLLPAATERGHVVLEDVFDREMIVYVAVHRVGPKEPSARAGCADRVLVSHRPDDFIDAVDVLLGDVISAEPGEVEPVAELPFHVAPAFLAGLHPKTSREIAASSGDDVADATAKYFVKGRLHCRVIAPAQAGDD